MARKPRKKRDIPVLTDAVDAASGEPPESTGRRLDQLRLAELRGEIVSCAQALAAEIARDASRDVEAALLGRLSARLQEELPELIDTILRERLNRAL